MAVTKQAPIPAEKKSIRSATVQPKVEVSQPGDSYEAEADAMAEKVTEAPVTGLIGRSVQRKADHGATGNSVSASFIKGLQSTKGAGEVMTPAVKQNMEHAFSANFSNVRLHKDNRADALSRSVQAKAFTYGNDIYFKHGAYSDETPQGTKLLAHELTHVLQQRPAIQRQEDGPPQPATTEPEPPTSFTAPDGGIIDTKAKKLFLPSLKVADELNKFIEIGGFHTFNKRQRPDDQRSIWEKQSMPAAIDDMIKTKAADKVVKDDESKTDYYYFKIQGVAAQPAGANAKGKRKSGNQNFGHVFGTIDDIRDRLKLPFWNKTGKATDFDVDHMVEWQIGGKHDMSNFWLWESSANRSAGSALNKHINETITELVKAAIAANQIFTAADKKKGIKAMVKELRANYEVTVRELVPELKIPSGRKEDHYNKAEIFEQALPLKAMNPMAASEIDKLRPRNGWIAVLLKRGNIVQLNMNSKAPTKIFNGLTLLSSDYHPDAKTGDPLANLHCELFKEIRTKNLIRIHQLDLPVKKLPRPAFFGIMPPRLTDHSFDMELVGMSPIEITGNGFNPVTGGVYATGVVHPSIPLLRDMPIDIAFDGESVKMSATFTAGDLSGKLPRFIKLNEGSITIGIDDKLELSVDGDLNFEISKLGTGSISAGYSKKEGFHLDGHFEFDKGLFDRSEISLSYKKLPDSEEAQFSILGDASLDTRKSKLFKKLDVHVGYDNGILSIGGEAITKLPGVSAGHVNVVVGDKETSIKAGFMLDNSIPGIESGELNFDFVKNEAGEFNIMADATVLTKFPGIKQVSVKGQYNSNGTFLFTGEALLNKGKFNGTVKFGITNQEIDKDGQPTGKPGKELVAFGKGLMNFKMNDWLGGSIGAEITPGGRVILSGQLKPDPVLPIIGKKQLLDERVPGFSLPEFSLFGIPHVANIYVTASGDFYINASVGPVVIRDAVLSFNELDIEHPEKTVVEGSGGIDIPGNAEAGVSVTVKAGLHIAVVDASVSFTGDVGFGITANAGMETGFTWSMQDGFKLKKSTAYLRAQAELIARLGGKISVDLDLLLGSINLYRHKFTIGEKRWPLDVGLNLNFPLRFDGEGGGLQLPGANEVTTEKPTIDEKRMTKAAIEDPPNVTPAPSKEKALKWLRGLPADFTAGSNWITNIFERYNYVKNLKVKYPEMDWGFLDDETKLLDQRDFNDLQRDLIASGSFDSDFHQNMRMMIIDNFVEEHKYVNYSQVEALKTTIRNMREK